MQGNIIETENYITPDEIERLIEAKLYRELKANITESKRVLRYVDKDIRHFMKKAIKQELLLDL